VVWFIWCKLDSGENSERRCSVINGGGVGGKGEGEGKGDGKVKAGKRKNRRRRIIETFNWTWEK